MSGYASLHAPNIGMLVAAHHTRGVYHLFAIVSLHVGHLVSDFPLNARPACPIWVSSCTLVPALRLRADTLLGVASVPLAPLLHDCWVDGYAPVYALLAAADGAQPAEKIQVGCVAMQSHVNIVACRHGLNFGMMYLLTMVARFCLNWLTAAQPRKRLSAASSIHAFPVY